MVTARAGASVLRVDDRAVIPKDDAGSYPARTTIDTAADDRRRGGRDRLTP
jgi:hypothetical protein